MNYTVGRYSRLLQSPISDPFVIQFYSKMSHYGNPNYNRQPSKLAQTILDPKNALKSAINNALTDNSRHSTGYTSSGYSNSGLSPYTGPNNFNNSQSSFGQTNTTNSIYPGGPPVNPTFSTSSPPLNPPLSQPIPRRPHSGVSFTSTSPPPSFSQIETPAAVIDSLLPPGRKSSPLLSHSRPHTPIGRDEHVQVNVPHEGENIHLDITLHSDGNQISRPSSRVSQIPSRDFVSTAPAYPARPALSETVVSREVSTPQPQTGMTFRAPNLSGLGPPSELPFPQNNMNMTMQGMGMMGMNMGMMGQNPMMSMNQSAPASKMYHRMINDYNTLRSGYYAAKISKPIFPPAEDHTC